MKKSIIFTIAALGLLTACDPSKDSITVPSDDLTSDQLSNGFTLVQYGDEGYTTEAANGNYFYFTTSPSRVVSIYQVDEEGAKKVLVAGVANGRFSIIPKRGNPTTQTFYIETQNFDGSSVVTQKTVEVFVPQDLSPEMRLLASDEYGYKVWTWDTEFRADKTVWGNMGYAAASGDSWIVNGDGIWWGTTAEGLAEQLGHSETGQATGEESTNATMLIYDDGNVLCFDAGGNQIRKGKISGVEGWTGERNHASADGSQANWSYGTLVTTEGAILFPFQINNHSDGHDKTLYPTRFEIMQLDANHLKLVYPQANTGSWTEATWWAFKSNSDPEAVLSGYGTKSWTWDTEFRADKAVWGNMGYAPATGDSWIVNGDGIWWGATAEGLADQLGHSDTGNATGEESADAYMTFDWKSGTVKSYDASGNEIRSGKYDVTSWNYGNRTQASADGSQANWALGNLYTDGGSILFPFQINSHSDGHDSTTTPSNFEIMQLDENHLKLIYPQANTGSWTEATWWAFKKK
ncbi:MAG: hypothetical protein IJ212_01550 [Bacteroidaceae bacterium]|nr:hypothetical protein [Bacteroidaceae bacterium]